MKGSNILDVKTSQKQNLLWEVAYICIISIYIYIYIYIFQKSHPSICLSVYHLDWIFPLKLNHEDCRRSFFCGLPSLYCRPFLSDEQTCSWNCDCALSFIEAFSKKNQPPRLQNSQDIVDTGMAKVCYTQSYYVLEKELHHFENHQNWLCYLSIAKIWI